MNFISGLNPSHITTKSAVRLGPNVNRW